MPAVVGRLMERQKFRDWLTAAEERNPSVVFVSGDPGVGKSNLADWLAEEARGVGRALVLRGGCIDLGGSSSIPYSALEEAVRLFGLRPSAENQSFINGDLWKALVGLMSASGAAHPTVDVQRRIFDAVLRLPDSLVVKQTKLVLILEDLHWADPSTLGLVRYLASAKSDQRLLVVCTHRSVPPKHPLRILLGEPDFIRRIEQVALPPFSRVETDEFVLQRAADAGRTVPEGRLHRYYDLSGGNAYYAEQLMITDDLEKLDVVVPQSLRAVITTQQDQLSDGAREVVRIAAVAGRRLDDALLTAVCELGAKALDDAMDECLNQQILVKVPVEDAYVLKHALLRDVVYGDIRPARRKELHKRMAMAMAAQSGAERRLLPELAYHWFEAGELPEAFAAGRQAAEMATRVGAFEEAAAQYGRVLSLWPDIPDAVARAGASREVILGRAADAARWAGDVAKALQWVRQAMAEVDPVADPARAGELQERLGSYLWEAGEREPAAAAYFEADRLLAGLPSGAVASRVKAALATAVIRQGKYGAGGDPARRAMELALSAGTEAEEGRALSALGLTLTFEGRFDEAVEALTKAVDIALAGNHLEDLFRAYGILGVCLEEGGRLPQAVTAMTEGLAHAKTYGLLNTRQSDVLAGNAAVAHFLLGQYRAAADLLDPILQNRPMAESMYARITRAEMYVAQGDYAGAEGLLCALNWKENSDPRFVGSLYGCTAELAAWRGHLDHADELVSQGMKDVAGTNPRVMVQLCATGLRIAADSGTVDRADELVEFVRACAAKASAAEVGPLVRQCEAEHARAHGRDTPDMWLGVAEGWAALRQPFRLAYAQFGLAGAAARTGERGQANAAFAEASAAAAEIGAGPLHARIAAAHQAMNSKPPYGLTPTELTVLGYLATGATNARIAELWGRAENTVGVHVGNIYKKMGVNSRWEAAEKARRDGALGG
ncbi:helix-turn-helix transcriptional regulator [Catellatospora sp. TT07R-123]|uniref:helix-turn-helix transcriptional regulator n=1 Tax=Catellatospora sp. TT07R-123 TaxID=2733863 RepID=UPI001BB43D84|nr:AAA family ATPase [Catellatospora sp. TT07R-123]